MPLVNCPECKRQVSTYAATCPACGFPLAGGGTTNAQGGRVQTMERTGKRFKLQQLLCNLLLITSLVLLLFGCLNRGEVAIIMVPLGVVLTLLSIIWLVLIRFLIWWHHA